MSAFPTLKSGAVAQYPLRREISYRTAEVRFLDGSAQRFRLRGARARRWTIRLDLLGEDELSALEEFFLARSGRMESFAFVDPRDGAAYQDCSFENEEAEFGMTGTMHGRTELIVRQNWS